MNDSNPSSPDPEAPAPEEIPVEIASAETSEVPSPEGHVEHDPLTAAQLEAEKWKDLAYRSQAELDNFRKRMARETQDNRAYANADLLRSLLPILDNFEMGLEAARAESEKSMIFMGMQMVHRQIQDFLKDFGVQEVEAAGKPFDPNLHDAVAQQVSTEHPDGTILEVKRRGYRLKERLLRPASVIVSTESEAAAVDTQGA